MDVLGIIQCRTSSARLPGKAAEVLSGRSVIEWVISRAKRSTKLTDLVIATPDSSDDDWLEETAIRAGLEVIRGSLDDVLSRYVTALERFPARAVVRITGDNPLTDPGLLDDLIDYFISENPDYAYVSEAPYGATADIFDSDRLVEVAKTALSPRQREHVNAAFLDNYLTCRITSLAPAAARQRPDVRLTLDDQNDLARLREIFKRLENPLSAGLDEIIAVYDGLPDAYKVTFDN